MIKQTIKMSEIKFNDFVILTKRLGELTGEKKRVFQVKSIHWQNSEKIFTFSLRKHLKSCGCCFVQVHQQWIEKVVRVV